MESLMSLLTVQVISPPDAFGSAIVTVHWGADVPPLQFDGFAFASKIVGLTIRIGGKTGASLIPAVLATRNRTARASRRSAKSQPLNKTVSRTRGITTHSSAINYGHSAIFAQCPVHLLVVD